MKSLKQKAQEKKTGWQFEEDEYDKKIKFVFDGVRNVLIATSVIGVGLFALGSVEGIWGQIVGWTIIFFGGCLLASLLNQWAKKTERHKFANFKTYFLISVIHLGLLILLPLVILLLVKQRL